MIAVRRIARIAALLLLGTGSSTALAGAQEPSIAPVEGRLVFESLRHDHGKIPDDAKVGHDFVFEVEGEAPVAIVDLRPGCSCTLGDVLVSGEPYEKGTPIPVGARGVIRTTYDPTGVNGIKPAVVEIDTRTGRGQYRLVLLADVLPTFEVLPRPVLLGAVRRGEKVVKEVWVRSQRFDSFEILDWGGPVQAAFPERPEGTSDDEYEVLIAQAQARIGLRIGAKPPEIEIRIDRAEKSKYRIVVEYTPRQAEGPFRVPLRFLTNRARVISFSLRGRIQPSLFLEPAPLAMPPMPFGERTEWGFEVKDLDGTVPFRLLSVQVHSEKKEHLDAEIFVSRENPKPLWLIRLGVRETMPRGGFVGEVEARTDHPLYPVLKTRFQGIIR